MKILVTGGAGFIGSHIVDDYLMAGHQVVVVDNLSTGRLENLNPAASFYLLDIRSPEMKKVFELENFDLINHQAAQKSVPASVENPFLDAEINILGILNLLNLSVQYGVEKFIFSSTGGALVGDAGKIPAPEKAEVTAATPYAITKHAGERYLDFFARTRGLKFTVLRYANVYGPRQAGEGECGVIPIFLENLFKGRSSLLYAYKEDPEGCTRDYVYVKDVSRANLLALDLGDNTIINIGSGLEVSTSQVYRLLQEAAGKKKIPLKYGGERAGDLRRSALDITKAKEILGWEPKVDLEAGLAQTVKYYKSRKS
ncbi:MAG: NAD-dependent epimerase/dehydratase family protein [Firmicutes bacterium]|nr:NAD-dependent epimerase/dehydratase family protein [Bacillota bacterium]